MQNRKEAIHSVCTINSIGLLLLSRTTKKRSGTLDSERWTHLTLVFCPLLERDPCMLSVRSFVGLLTAWFSRSRTSRKVDKHLWGASDVVGTLLLRPRRYLSAAASFSSLQTSVKAGAREWKLHREYTSNETSKRGQTYKANRDYRESIEYSEARNS